MTEKYQQKFKSIEDYYQELSTPRSRQEINDELVKTKKHKSPIRASHNEGNSQVIWVKPQTLVGSTEINKNTGTMFGQDNQSPTGTN